MDKGIIRSEFILKEPPFENCHASTIVETPKGLIISYFAGSKEGNDDVGIWVSRQEKGQWMPPVEVANGFVEGDKRYPSWNPVLYMHVNRVQCNS